jgi:predicted metalloprotease with PDZ domain
LRCIVASAAFVLVAAPLVAAPLVAAPRGPIRLSVDAREAPRKILHARLSLPVTPGPLTLLYPKWIPGEHGPSGPIVNLAGLKLSAGGQPVAWRRDPGDMFTFHCDVPKGATTLDVELDALLPTKGDFTAGRSATAELVVLSWNTVLLYPQGSPSDALVYEAALTLPAGWTQASALAVAGREGDEFRFQPVTLTRLVDSPVLAGAHAKDVRLGAGDPPHWLSLAADSEAALALKPEWQRGLERLVDEAGALFGARHYASYRFLLALSEHVEHFGLEHHESSDNRLGEDTLADDSGRRELGGLLSHEYVHSWNGKYRRPADLATPGYQQPMKSELLWVYEGLTQYLGNLLAARSGLLTPEETREHLAQIAARYAQQPGRSWRPLVDTAVAAQVLYGAAPEWAAWRREVDFYDEMALVWLEADAIIRRETRGARALDDFCRAFHGGAGVGPYVVKPYTREDVIAGLNAVAPYDWRGFFAARVEAAGAPAPLGGIEAGGWRLAYSAEPNVFIADREEREKALDHSHSIGVVIKLEDDEYAEDYGRLRDVVPGTPAARAGLAPGLRLVAVNGRRFTKDVLRDALAATAQGGPLELLAENNDYFKTYRVEYDGGPRYPHLARDESRPDTLSGVFAPLAAR